MTIKAKIIQAFKIWIVIYPSIILFNVFIGNQLVHLPLHIKSLTLTLVLVPWMVFIGLPLVNKIQQKLSRNGKP